ncbi:MAG: glycerate kinase [Deltaproteobacteria bacterium]|nr:glycerate kinase [Deltaproteobacteria bacterium]
MNDPAADAKSIFLAGVAAADPYRAVAKALGRPQGSVFPLGGEKLDVSAFGRVILVGAGKAACPMARAVEDLLGDRISAGAVVTKYGHGEKLSRVSVAEAGHPVPDENGEKAARNILDLAGQAGEGDLVVCLLSGGGSALLPVPAPGITLAHKQAATQALLDSGATIHEVNALRKHLSAIKGGQLARAAAPARVVTLILSDVVGDDLSVIASGPTAPDESTFSDCVRILHRYNLSGRMPRKVLDRIGRGQRGEVSETPKPGDPAFAKGSWRLVANARQSLFAAADKARELGYNTLILSAEITGETRDAALVHAGVAREVLASGNPVAPPACLLSGGETTVTIRGRGKGGRNMEFALASALALEGAEGVLVLSGGTDGTDGPTDAAGAWADGKTTQRAREMGLDPRRYLDDNDSYRFFEQAGGLLVTGPTKTNVMDLRVILVRGGSPV